MQSFSLKESFSFQVGVCVLTLWLELMYQQTPQIVRATVRA